MAKLAFSDKFFAELTLLVLSFSVMSYVSLTDRQAFDWPAIDSAPYFVGKTDPTILKNDFFTQASLARNPRNVFNWPIFYLARAVGLDWYQTFYVLKLLVAFYFPLALIAFVYRVGLEIGGKAFSGIAQPRYFLALSVCLFVLSTNVEAVNRWTSIGWWAPVLIQGTPSMFAMLLGFLSFGLSSRSGRFLRVLAIVIHPAIGSFVWIVNAILVVRSLKDLLIEGLLIFAPIGLLGVAFHPRETLSAARFIKIYFFDATPSHHVISELGSLSSYPWYLHYLGLSALISVCLFYLRRFLERSRWLRLCGINFLYVLAPPGHWLLTEILALKPMAMLAPVRFSTFGLYIAILNLLLVFGKRLVPDNRSTGVSFGWVSVVGALIAIPLSLVASSSLPSFRDQVFGRSPQFWNFILDSDRDALFVVPHGPLATQIPLLAGRAVYFGNGFPFSEDFFEEYERRLAQTYGTYEDIRGVAGTWIGAKYNLIYHMKGPRGFCEIPADFFILESPRAAAFDDCKAVYSDPEYRVYEREMLCACSRLNL